MIVLALGAGAAARHQLGYWRDTDTLMHRALAVTHHNYKAHDNIGSRALKAGRTQEMTEHFRAGMQARRALGMLPADR
jgi:uncharacterized protein (DUF58 family)